MLGELLLKLDSKAKLDFDRLRSAFKANLLLLFLPDFSLAGDAEFTS